jgi:8-oxo-dGTP diphosphatase
LIRNAPTKAKWPNLYNGIGGHIEPGETVLEGALREITEETGINKLHRLALRGMITITADDNPGVILFVFSAHANANEITASKEGTPEWISIAALDTIPLIPDLAELLPRVLRPLRSTRDLFHGHYDMTANDQARTRFS